MAAHEDALLAAPKQPEQDAYLAAVTDLLLCIASPRYLDDASVDALLDAMTPLGMREELRVGLAEHGLLYGSPR
jgi:hypothetical protein